MVWLMEILKILTLMAYKFFDKKTSASGIKNESMSDQQLADKLHRLIIWKFNKRKAQSPIIDNVWGADLADTQLTSKFNKGICFLSFVIDIFSKYSWVISLKDKRVLQLLMLFKNF